MSTEKWVRERADTYLRHGGKQHRRDTVRILANILDEIRAHEGCLPGQIGRRQIIGYYKRQKLAAATLRRHYAAVCLLWVWLGRTGKPPRPERSVVNCPAHTPP